jgi:O-antigen/teichoic acid export membrane protein
MSQDGLTQTSSAAAARLVGAAESYERPPSLGPAVSTGIKWKLVSLLAREGTRIGVGIMLARLLTPDEWGVASIALVVAAFFQMIPDLALGYSLVQRPSITEHDRSTVFWLSLGLGVGVTLVGIGLSGVIADVFSEPQVEELFRAVSIGFTISALAAVPTALLTRDLAYRSLELRYIAGTFAGGIVAVTLALAGAGAWAIVGNSLAAIVASTLLVWIVTPWRPRFMFSRASARSLGSFGATVFGSQLLLYAQLNSDKVLVGRYLGAGALGLYSFAYNLMFTPILNVAFPLQQVLFPALATIQEDEDRLRAAWLRGKRLAVAILAPTFLLVAIVAPDLVPTVFGERWEDAVPVLQLLCVAGVAYSLGTLDWSLLVVRGRVRALLLLSALLTIGVTSAVAIGLRWDLEGVAACYAAAQWLLVLPAMWITTRAGRVDFRPTLRAAGSSLPFAVAAAAAGYGVRWAMLDAGMPAIVRIIATAATMATGYAALAWLFSPPLRAEIRRGLARISRSSMKVSVP